MTATALSILLVEDEEAHIVAIERAFAKGRTKAAIRVVANLREYRESIGVFPPDIVIMDLNLSDGLAVEALVSPAEEGPFPILVMTSHGDEHMAVQAIKAGAMDYIVKSADVFAGMPRSVERALREWKLLRQHKQSQLLLRVGNAALAAAANSILITDRHGIIVYVNPAFTLLTGYDSSEAIGKTPGQLLKSGKHDEVFYRKFWETILSGKVWQGEMTNRRKDGSHYTDEQMVTPVPDENGRIGHFISIRQDITLKKKMEEHLLRTQRLDSVGQLAAGLAHDLNNILAPILMAVPMIREEVQTPTTLRMIDIVDSNVRRGAELINHLLVFGRGTEGQRKPLQLKSLIRDMANIVEETFPKNIQFHGDSSPDLWWVNADSTQMHQVLMNLCVNARDAMPSGGTLSISLENGVVDEASALDAPGVVPGSYVVMSVVDTGVGIPEHQLSKIFDPFFTTKAVGHGTGLGLSTVLGIVKSHGGVIQVRSNVGHGTQFKVYLPTLEVPVDVSPKGHSVPHAARPGRMCAACG